MLPRRALGVAIAFASALGLVTLGAGVAMAAAPTVTISSPEDLKKYEIGAVVLADFECTEVGAQTPPTCVGDVDDGDPIDTDSVGVKTFTVVSTSNVDSTPAPPEVHSYTVEDTMPPSGGTLDLPPFTAGSTQVTATAASDPSGPIEYGLSESGDVEPPATAFSTSLPTTFTFWTPDGAKTLYLWARDSLGNPAPVTSATTFLDTAAPAAPTLTGQPGPLSAHNAALVFSWTGDDDPNSGRGTYNWRVRNSAGQVTRAGTLAAGPGATQVNVGALPSNASYSFEVQQTDRTGNSGAFSAPVAFSILPPPDTPPAPGGSAPVPAPPVAAASPSDGGASPGTSAATDTRFTPATSNAKRLRPKAAQKLSGRRPVLRWPRVRSASVYNVQIFRVEGTSFVKIYSGFPRSNRMRVPAGKLRFGERYVWRVWPFKGRKATKNPVGSSWFDVRTKAEIYTRRVLGPKAVLVAGETAQIRWRPRAGTKQYRVRLLKDGDRMFQAITRRKRASIPGSMLNETGTYTLLVHLGKGKPKARKFGAAWIKAPLQVATAAQLAELRASRQSSR